MYAYRALPKSVLTSNFPLTPWHLQFGPFDTKRNIQVPRTQRQTHNNPKMSRQPQGNHSTTRSQDTMSYSLATTGIGQQRESCPVEDM